jgi:DNA helicase II / ATP-dependent DNA helicase PcrA
VPQDTPDIVTEEQTLLADIRRRLLENPLGDNRTSEGEIALEIRKLQSQLGTCKEEDKAAMLQQIDQLAAIVDQVRKQGVRAEVNPDSPYFAHMRLAEQTRERDVFLGRATRLSHGIRIVDWRNAPISKLFYRYEEGDEYAEEMAGRVREGTVTVRRTMHIDQGELARVDAADSSFVRTPTGWTRLDTTATQLTGGQGAALRAGKRATAILGSGEKLRADKHLPDIAALIDPEQFELITGPNSGVVVLRGAAGTGKTTVALHRIAYLNYAHPHQFSAGRILVVVWGRAMRDYVAHVLPALGVDGVQVTTWEKWARTMVKRHYPRLPGQISDDTPEPVVRLKLHPGIAQALADAATTEPNRRGPEAAFEDWGRVLTDKPLLARVMGDDISSAQLDRAHAWCTAQWNAVNAWWEGDREADARLDSEDDALLLRAWQLRIGPLRSKKKRPLDYAHMALDEVQDFSPIEVQVLLGAASRDQCVTLAGDTRQHITQHAGFSSWAGFLDRIGVTSTALNTLAVSYRSTHPITEFAVSVLEDEEQPARTLRSGPPVELFRFSDHGAAVAFLARALRRLVDAEPLANIALLTPDATLARLYFDGMMASEVPDTRLVENQRFAFKPGIDVVPVAEIKGLEFDYVVVIEASAAHWPDTPHHRRLLHVAATRAVHQLWLTAVGTPTSILPKPAE